MIYCFTPLKFEFMTEKNLERKLKKEVEKLGGLCLKLVTPGFTGIPDRLILLPGGKVWFVEVKKPTGRLSTRQEIVIPQLLRLEHKAKIIWNLADLLRLVQDLKNDLQTT